MAEIDVGVEKLKSLVDDKVFSKKLKALKTADEVQSFLQENGVNLDADVVKTMWSLVSLHKEGKINDKDLDALENGELTESMMEAINGGVITEEAFNNLQANNTALQTQVNSLQTKVNTMQAKADAGAKSANMKVAAGAITAFGKGLCDLLRLYLTDD